MTMNNTNWSPWTQTPQQQPSIQNVNPRGWGFGAPQQQMAPQSMVPAFDPSNPAAYHRAAAAPTIAGSANGTGILDVGSGGGTEGPSKWWGGTAADGSKTPGYIPMGADLIQGGINSYIGLGQLGLAEDTYNTQKAQWQSNWDQNVKDYNRQLTDRQTARYRMNPEDNLTPDAYLEKYGA